MENQSKKNILIVDDEPDVLMHISNIFYESGLPYNIINAPNGKVALRLINKVNPDLIITDWEMPVMDGIALIKAAKANDDSKDIPIIMCTGAMLSSQDLETALEAGAVDYIRKPIDSIELIARTKANLHLGDSYKKIKKLNQVNNNIFSIISHDLRAPIGNLKAFMDIFFKNSTLSNLDADDILEFIVNFRTQSASVYNTVENLFFWAYNQRNNIGFNPESQNLNLVIEENVTLLLNAAKGKQIEIINNCDREYVCSYDFTLISGIIRNLIANAIKFTPQHGLITIESRQENGNVKLLVKDTGIGIKADKIEKMLDKNSYETISGTDDEIGSGLGLNICLEFIEKHNGYMQIDSEVGKGSTFTITFPESNASS